MYNNGNSSKNVTGSSIVDGTVETADLADDAVTVDKLANAINTDIATGVSGSTTAGDALPKAGGAMTGAITTNSTFDGVDIATRDGILTTTTATANDALPKAGGTMTGTIAGFESTGIDDNATATSLRIDATTGDVSVGVGNSKEPLIQKTNSGRVASNPGFSFRSDLDTGMFNPNLSNTLAFATGGVERVRILSSGGITFNGDTAAANALDDYEEGTWTPVVKFGGTTQSVTGVFSEYIKIGKQVTIFMRWYNSTSVSGTGNMEVEGLPFTPDTDSEFYFGMPCPTDRFVIDDGYISATVYPGDTKLRFFKAKNSNTSGPVSVTNTDVSSNNSQIRMVLIYQTA